jgi:hypothetical protein
LKAVKTGSVLLFLFALGGAVPAAAARQPDVTTADIQRLHDTIYDASRDIARARTRDTSLASQLQSELDDVRDEATYLKVKLRKREPISRSEYADLRDRIEDIGNRARGDAGEAYSTREGWRSATNDRPTASVRRQNLNEVPVGTEFDVRLQHPLSSATAQVEDRFEATTLVDLRDDDNRVLAPAGSVMRGVISSVTKAGRLERKGVLTVAFDQVTVKGRSYPMRATVIEALESEGLRGEKAKIGIGAGAGAIIGGILGGVKGAVAGVLIGGGGTIAATEGKDVDLPPGTVLRVRMDSALNLAR